MFAPDDDPDALSVEAIMLLAHVAVCPGICRVSNGGSNIEEEHFINRLRENLARSQDTLRSLHSTRDGRPNDWHP